jgi:hypothetical protein
MSSRREVPVGQSHTQQLTTLSRPPAGSSYIALLLDNIEALESRPVEEKCVLGYMRQGCRHSSNGLDISRRSLEPVHNRLIKSLNPGQRRRPSCDEPLPSILQALPLLMLPAENPLRANAAFPLLQLLTVGLPSCHPSPRDVDDRHRHIHICPHLA